MNNPLPQDAISLAGQLGRLDFVSAILGSITIILALGGIVAFLNLRKIAKSQAVSVSTKIAEDVAERAANEYLQRELPNVIEAYRAFLDPDKTSDEKADELASVQEKPGG